MDQCHWSLTFLGKVATIKFNYYQSQDIFRLKLPLTLKHLPSIAAITTIDSLVVILDSIRIFLSSFIYFKSSWCLLMAWNSSRYSTYTFQILPQLGKLLSVRIEVPGLVLTIPSQVKRNAYPRGILS